MHAPVSKVLDAIENQTPYLFVCPNLDLSREVTLDIKDKPVEQVLNELFLDTDIAWRIDGVNIYLTRKIEKPAKTQEEPIKNQTPTIKGKVIDSQGIPIPGVAILLNGKTDGAAITDNEGDYTIAAAPGDALLFTSLGYIDVSTKVGNASVLNITMQDEAMNLDETVVVGYRTVKKLSMTGAVSSLDLKQKENQPLTNTSQLLYNTPGVFVNQGGSKPGADAASITIS